MPLLMHIRPLYFRQPVSWFLAVFALLLLFAPGCGGGPPEDGIAPTLQVRGPIIGVVARHIAQGDSRRHVDECGSELHAIAARAGDQTGGFVGFTPSHLKEHQLLGQTVLVSYGERDGLLVIVKIED